MLPTSPTPRPSTKIAPACTRPPLRPPSLSNSKIWPLSPIRTFLGSTPIATPSSPWRRNMRYSPWTGIKYSGRTRLSIVLSSSWLAWPDTWIPRSLPYTTWQPNRSKLSIVLPTAPSLPGIGVAEMITVSFGANSTVRWLLVAIRDKPAIGSPWEPVVKIIIWSSV